MLNDIKKRYTAESAACCDLSCGSNLSFLQIQSGDIILDLGCGRGKETMEAAQLAGPAGAAVGLDLTDAMISAAESGAAAAGIENVRFVVGNIEHLPFEDKSFSAVISNCVINHARDKKGVFREIHRVLEPNGRFVISDAVSKYPLPQEVKNDPEAWAQCFGGAVTEEEYMDSIRSAGFDHVEILSRREYLKNNFDFISLTIMATR